MPATPKVRAIEFVVGAVCLALAVLVLFTSIPMIILVITGVGPIATNAIIVLVVLGTWVLFFLSCLLNCCLSPAGFCGTASVPVEDIDQPLYFYWQQRPDRARNLPDKLRGVFWMSNNPVQELCASFEGTTHDPVKRTMDIWAYGRNSWTRSSNVTGYLTALFGATLVFGTRIRFNFNEDYTYADMPMYIFWGLVKVPDWYARFTIKQLDDDTWARDTWSMGKYSDYGSYTLKRVVNEFGTRLPAFDDMVRDVRDGKKVKGAPPKTPVQVYSTQFH